MITFAFEPLSHLASGLFVGISFGFLLRKGYVTRFNVIVGQLILKDFTVMKIILTAIAFGSAGLYSLLYFFPNKTLMIDPTTLFSALVGGAIFGIGMTVMGYCPGTGIGALADGAHDMWFGVVGMIVGAALYAESYVWVTQYIKPVTHMTTITLPQFFGASPLIIIGGIFLILYALSFLKDRHIN